MVRPFKMTSLALSTSPTKQVPVDLHSTDRNVLAIAPTSGCSNTWAKRAPHLLVPKKY